MSDKDNEYIEYNEFDTAFLGVTTDNGLPYKVIYDKAKCIKIIKKNFKISHQEAINFFEDVMEDEFKKRDVLLLNKMSLSQYKQIMDYFYVETDKKKLH